MTGRRKGSNGSLTRRDFVGLAMTPLVLKLTACSGDDDGGAGGPTGSSSIPSGSVLLGLYGGDGAAALRAAAPRLDFSWLKPGDTVLIKVAVNSPFPHPSTTSPAGVAAMVSELKARGAGRVIVADQSGVEHVRSSSRGRFGSTRDMFERGGLISLEGSAAELHFFDDQPYDSGYFPATLPANNSWPRGMYLPSILKSVDHIVYMPRIGAHVLAGNTLGQKMAIGWLRDDSRHDLHNDAVQFYEKYVEINHAEEIRSRLRLTVTVSEQVLLHGGPDVGTPYAMSPVLLHASTSLVNHDAVGASILAALNRRVTTVSPGALVYDPSYAAIINSAFAGGVAVGTGEAGPWTSDSPHTEYVPHDLKQGISHDRALTHGFALSGGKPASIRVVPDGAALDAEIRAGIEAHGENLYAFV